MDKKYVKLLIILSIVLTLTVIGLISYIVIIKDTCEKSENDKVTISEEKDGKSEKITYEEVDRSTLGEDMIFQTETLSLPEWVTSDPYMADTGPWHNALYISTSDDGLTFTDDHLYLEHAGVANIIQTTDGLIIATFQYFSFADSDMFDVIAYSTSKDNGKTWRSVEAIKFSGLELGGHPVDPTLVELENGDLRLYFTYHPDGEEYPQLYSAKASTIDSVFVNEGQQLDTDFIVLDPVVVQFNGMWHHYTVKHGTDLEGETTGEIEMNPVSVHSISEDGLNFELQDEIDIGMQFLGDVIIEIDGLRFYNGQQSAFSKDGYSWIKDSGSRVEGADPGVVKLEDGSYLMIYTGAKK